MLRRLPVLVALLCADVLYGQGVMQPLNLQGLERQEVVSVRARGMGSVFAALPGSAESVTLNPASLASVSRPALTAGGLWQARNWAETQHWNPNRYYAGLSLYFSDLEDYHTEPLKNPDWTHRHGAFQLASLGGVMPLRLADRDLAVGAMAHQVAYLGDYDRNNNVLDPYIGQFRPEPVPRPKPGEEIEVQWSSFVRERTGHLRALTGAVGVALTRTVHVGVRVSRVQGTAADMQENRARGVFLLREDAHDYSHEPAQGTVTWDGTSKVSSWRSALGLRLQYSALALGVTWQFPFTLTREYSYRITGLAPDAGDWDPMPAGTNEITVPARIVVGAALQPVPSVLLAVDYVRQDFAALKTRDAAPDWGLVHGIGLGIEWALRPWSTVRAGFRRDPQPFRITGSGLLDETAVGDAFSIGFGQMIREVTLQVSYEFQRLHYHDRWESNVDYNRINQHNVLFGAAYSF